MPEYTENYGLTLPLKTENYDLDHMTDSMEIIDTELKRVDDKAQEVEQDLTQHKQDYVEFSENIQNRIDPIEEQVGEIKDDFESLENDYATFKDNTTLKVAKVEKELNDYRATMQQVNINQEPKQKATGYGVISLPPNAANGQISATLRGLTATNVVKNGNFSQGTTGWTSVDSVNTATNNVLSNTGDGAYVVPRASYGDASCYKVGHKYYFRAIVRVTNSNCTRIRHRVFGADISDFAIVSPIQNQWYVINHIFTVMSSSTSAPYIGHVYPDAATANGKVMEVKEVIAIDLTAHGLENKTVDELNKMFPYWFGYGTKSTISACRLKSVGKNILDIADGNINSNGITCNISNGEITLNGTATAGTFIKLTKLLDARTGVRTSWLTENSIKVDKGKKYAFGFNLLSGSAPTGVVAFGLRTFENTGILLGNNTPYNPIEILQNSVYPFAYLFINNGASLNNYKFKLQLEKNDVSTPYEPYIESTQYVIVKDKVTGEIIQAGSLPNGTKDEVRVADGKLIKRVSDYAVNSEVLKNIGNTSSGIAQYLAFELPLNNYLGNGTIYGKRKLTTAPSNEGDATNTYRIVAGSKMFLYLYFPINTFSNINEAQNWVVNNPITLTYQLAEPVEIPIEVSGSLVSHPSGTVYIEPVVADAGVYTDKMEVLHQDLPIKAIENVSKVDFLTGVETELDIDGIVIAEDKLSFTHPDLSDGDIVFFEYEYDREGTIPETEIEYYDSRYTIKDSVTDKFYKWNVTVADGVPSIELVEV